MDGEACPKCGGNALTNGNAVRGMGGASQFQPENMRWFQFRVSQGVPLADGFRACLSCGLVWSRVAPDELRAFIEKHGTAETKGPPAP